ncbi:hypothetical protein [Pseudokineococcus sp. 1T1Z-3]|uniref:hypothetical protein n=1 Tax=Pseudokineococcus sp. 1T1Z-3 TaxID=3132745 RepID=UPI00309A1356
MTHNRRSISVAFAGAALLISSSATGAQAATDVTTIIVPAATDTADLTPVDLRDLTTLANQTDTPLSDIVEEYGPNHDFSVAVDTIAERYPDQFAASVYANGPGEVSSVSFVGAVPPPVIDMLAGLAVDVRLEGGYALSAVAAEEVADAAVTTLRRESNNTDFIAAGSADPRTGVVDVKTSVVMPSGALALAAESAQDVVDAEGLSVEVDLAAQVDEDLFFETE